MDNVIRIATSQPNRPVRGCATCRFFKPSNYGATLHQCHATGTYADYARRGECQHGALWEAKTQRIPVLVAIKRWLVG